MQLSEWLIKHNVKRTDFAKRVGVSPQTITGWCKGTFWIDKKRAKEVFDATNGAVTPTDFMQADDAGGVA